MTHLQTFQYAMVRLHSVTGESVCALRRVPCRHAYGPITLTQSLQSPNTMLTIGSHTRHMAHIGTHTLSPARSGRDDSGRSANPNRGHFKTCRMTPAPRLSDGTRYPVRVTWSRPGRVPRTLGTLPRVKAKRRAWTLDRLFALALHAARNGHSRIADQLLESAAILESRTLDNPGARL